MKLPKFSIITICYNEAKSIRATCDSICTQSCRDYEWIVIDGGSTDGTLLILKEYEGSIDCLVSEQDSGIYNAMNKGAALATGDYLIFMNGGDSFANADVLDAVAECPSGDIIVGQLKFAGESDVRTFPLQLPPGYLLRHMLPHQATFFHRAIFGRFGSYDESFEIAGDYEFFVRMIEKNKASYRYIPKILAVFAGGGMSSSSHQRALRKRENHRVRWKYFIRYRFSLKAWRQQFRGFCLKE